MRGEHLSLVVADFIIYIKKRKDKKKVTACVLNTNVGMMVCERANSCLCGK